ncbi:MAG: benzoyl-CoA 2,3-epoxidase subunit BoxB, partial [Gammaproteobacteria bacterium]|nr:benzoyl-CoA 2,3-epoxidase subunit BoxB [Gammaproteobacteria bacterium]
YSVTIDLFGAEVSTNAASMYTNGLKGRYNEHRIDDDHQLNDVGYSVMQWQNDALSSSDVPAANALNERLRDDFIQDVSIGVRKWNRLLKENGIDFELTLPHRAFNRQIGGFRDVQVTPSGDVISAEEWDRRRTEWFPSDEDFTYVRSLMEKPVLEPGKFANWISPPTRGVNKEPANFEYVRFN